MLHHFARLGHASGGPNLARFAYVDRGVIATATELFAAKIIGLIVVTNLVGVDPDPANKDRIISWAREYWKALHPHCAPGAYVNFMMADEGDERIQATYGPNYARLAAVKATYDPHNLFRVNQNIKPAG